MAQIGKPFFKKNVEARIKEVFLSLLVAIKNREEAESFLELLLTTTEKVNLPKRLGALILLTKKTNWRNIKDLLHVSLPMIAKVNEKLLTHGLMGLTGFVRKILKEDLPSRETGGKSIFAGKRVFPKKGERVKKPFLDLPY